MKDWNAVVTVQEHGYKSAMTVLREFGDVDKTEFFNVLLMRVNDPVRFLGALHAYLESLPTVRAALARVMPVTETFSFQSPEEFESAVVRRVDPWLTQLADSRFHVRMHRRGFKGRLSSQQEEQFLDHTIVDSLRRHGREARIDFSDPDFIIALETVGQDGGLSLWDREQRSRYPLLKLD